MGKLLLLVTVAALLSGSALAGQNNRVGQNEWCWVSGSSDVEFCDYSSYGGCRDANKGKDGTCIKSLAFLAPGQPAVRSRHSALPLPPTATSLTRWSGGATPTTQAHRDRAYCAQAIPRATDD